MCSVESVFGSKYLRPVPGLPTKAALLKMTHGASGLMVKTLQKLLSSGERVSESREVDGCGRVYMINAMNPRASNNTPSIPSAAICQERETKIPGWRSSFASVVGLAGLAVPDEGASGTGASR